jgi:hypothetical protein
MSKDKTDKTDLELKMEEYKELSTNMRHYGTVQFAQISVFVAITAGLFNFFNSASSSHAKNVLALAGFLISVFFAMILETPLHLWSRLAKRATELEKDLNFKQYSNLKKWSLFGKEIKYNFTPYEFRLGTWGVRFLYSFICIGWILLRWL